MTSLLISIGIVFLAEMGDKTQLIALLLAAQFQKPVPIILGILGATLLNHLFAGWAGLWLSYWIAPDTLRWVTALLFFGMGIWMFIPDRLDKETCSVEKPSTNVFFLTLVTFFLAEIGDKTQIATLTLAAHYQTPVLVVIGTTLGMLLADLPAVYIGASFTKKIPLKGLNRIAAVLFILLGFISLAYPIQH